MESTRPARGDDLARIVELAGALHAELGPMKGGSLWARREARRGPLDAAYEELLARDDALVIVGSVDDAIMGFGAVELETLPDGGRLGLVTELFVEPGARAIGVGEAMIGALIVFCSTRGCIGMDALALPGHRATKNFFEESGFTARALVMHRSLS